MGPVAARLTAPAGECTVSTDDALPCLYTLNLNPTTLRSRRPSGTWSGQSMAGWRGALLRAGLTSVVDLTATGAGAFDEIVVPRPPVPGPGQHPTVVGDPNLHRSLPSVSYNPSPLA